MKDLTKVFNCDCLPKMREFPDKHFDLAIVDCPYGIGFDGETESMVTNNASGKWSGARGKGYKRKEWDTEKPTDDYFQELFRISKKQIIWGGNYFILPPSGGWVVWDKRRPDDFSLSQAELAWVSGSGRVAIFSYLWNGFAKQVTEERIHPTQKPVALYKWLLKNYAKEGDKILDSHGGSMSSVIACLDMGFSITCYELDPDYYNAGKNRIINHLKQLNAFRPAYDIEFHDNSGLSELRNNAGIGYKEQKDRANNNPIHRVDGLFHGHPSQSDIQTPKAS